MKHIILLLIFLSYPVIAEESDLDVIADLFFIEDTEIESGNLCFGDDGCVTWSTFYIFEARVNRVIKGVESEKRFKVILGRHALLKEDILNVQVELVKLKPENEFKAKYQVVRYK